MLCTIQREQLLGVINNFWDPWNSTSNLGKPTSGYIGYQEFSFSNGRYLIPTITRLLNTMDSLIIQTQPILTHHQLPFWLNYCKFAAMTSAVIE